MKMVGGKENGMNYNFILSSLSNNHYILWPYLSTRNFILKENHHMKNEICFK